LSSTIDLLVLKKKVESLYEEDADDDMDEENEK
jgi:hypothetical protein